MSTPPTAVSETPVEESNCGVSVNPDRSVYLRTYLPIALLVALFLLLGAFVATQAEIHGQTWDEGLQDWYGEATYQWYATKGADESFMHAAPQLQMPQHGPFFETIVAAAQHAFEDTDRWQVRRLVCGIAGVLGVLGMALCGLELGGWWLAFLSAAGLTLYPRYTGAIFNNSKDIPLAVAMIFLLWLTLRLARRWADGSRYLSDSVLVGICLGAAIAIRVNALLWAGILGLTAIGWWLRHRRTAFTVHGWRRPLMRQAIATLLIAGCAYFTMLVLWPYTALYPVDGLIDSIRSMSKYAWDGSIWFEGERLPASEISRRYAPEWLIISTPLSTILAGLLGAGFIVADLVRRRRLDDPRVLLPAALLGVPMASFVLMQPTLYNGPRHFLFVIPGLVLLGAVGLVRFVSTLLAHGRQLLIAGVATVLLLGVAETVVAAYRLYPMEYMYFSPIVGGYPQAQDDFETDYWGVCQNPALDWLVAHHQEYPTGSPPSVGGLFDPDLRTPPGFVVSDNPHFFISSAYYPVPDGYLPIHRIEVYGSTVCAVNIHPAYAPR